MYTYKKKGLFVSDLYFLCFSQNPNLQTLFITIKSICGQLSLTASAYFYVAEANSSI